WTPLSVFPLPTHGIHALHAAPVPLSHTTAAVPYRFPISAATSLLRPCPAPLLRTQSRSPPVAFLFHNVAPWRQVPRRPDPRPRDLQRRSPPPFGSTAAASGPRQDSPRAHVHDGLASSSRSMGTRPRASTMAAWWGRWEVLLRKKNGSCKPLT
ncbi:hypothetical protein EJB05_30639, partial [Eragrostis curvula]